MKRKSLLQLAIHASCSNNTHQKSLKHPHILLSLCNVEMWLQSYVLTTTLQKGGIEETKDSRTCQSVSRFLSEIVACTNPKVISTSLKIFLMSRIDNCSSAIKIPQKPSYHLPSGKWRTEFPSLIAKSTSPVLSDTIFFAHCYFTVQPINCNKYLFYHASF